MTTSHAENLPIHIEDSHTGSFGFFAQTLDLDASCTLVLIDGHSDASGIPESDRLRRGVRRVVSESERLNRIEHWREAGVIQPFNWIEPLMPRPITRVIWIAGESLSEEKLRALKKEAGIQLDWETQVMSRNCGDLKSHYEVTDWQRFCRNSSLSGDVVVSIDLDYYVSVAKRKKGSDKEVKKVFADHWRHLMRLPRLKALSIAVSRPWLNSDMQSYQFLEMALHQVLLTKNVRVNIDPYVNDQNDRSHMAKEYLKKGLQVPRLNIEKAPESLRDVMLRLRLKMDEENQSARITKLLNRWQSEASEIGVYILGRQVSIDGVWRMPLEKLDDIRLTLYDDRMWQEGDGAYVRWWKIESESATYNIESEGRLGKQWTAQSTSIVTEKKTIIAQTSDLALASRTWKRELPWPGEAGAITLQAEFIQKGKDSRWSPQIAIRVRNREGVLGELVEQMGVPYVFGIGKYHQAGESGPETLLGNDCANFLVMAMRRVGIRIPWCNPQQIRRHLKKSGGAYRWSDFVSGALPKIRITDELIRQGIVVHLGSHIAVVWEDRGSEKDQQKGNIVQSIKGQLDPTDLVIHHLGGRPEIITLSELMKGRGKFDIYTLPRVKIRSTIVLGGDVNLAERTKKEKSGKPKRPEISKKLKMLIREADFSMINLECAFSEVGALNGDRKNPQRGAGGEKCKKRFTFVASDQEVDWLVSNGVDAVSLANNHSMDAGEVGLKNTIEILNRSKIATVGVTKGASEMSSILMVDLHGVRVAWVAINTIEVEKKPKAAISGESQYRVNSYRVGKDDLALSIIMSDAQDDADLVIVLPHWGDEYTGRVTEQQRDIARRLIRLGADGVIGSHSHHPQRLEYYRGVPILYSLGNLYFPWTSPKEGFNDNQLLKLGVDSEHQLKVMAWPVSE